MYKDDGQSYKDAANCADDAMAAVMFLKGADPSRHGQLLRDLHNQHTRGLGKYPKYPISVYVLMTVFDSVQNKRKTGVTMENEGVIFISNKQKDKACEEKKETIKMLSLWGEGTLQVRVFQV